MSNAWQRLFRQMFGGTEAETGQDNGSVRIPSISVTGFEVRDIRDHETGHEEPGDVTHRVVLAPNRGMELRAARISRGRPMETVLLVTYRPSLRDYQVVSEVCKRDADGEMTPAYALTIDLEALDRESTLVLGTGEGHAPWREFRGMGEYALLAIRVAFRSLSLIPGIPMSGEEVSVSGITSWFGEVVMAVQHPAPHESIVSFLLVGRRPEYHLPNNRAVVMVHRPESATHSVTLIREGMARVVREVRPLRSTMRMNGERVREVFAAWSMAEGLLGAMLRTGGGGEQLDGLIDLARQNEERYGADRQNMQRLMRDLTLTAGSRIHRRPIGQPIWFGGPIERQIGARGEDLDVRMDAEGRMQEVVRAGRDTTNNVMEAILQRQEERKAVEQGPPMDEGISTGKRRIRVRRSVRPEESKE